MALLSLLEQLLFTKLQLRLINRYGLRYLKQQICNAYQVNTGKGNAVVITTGQDEVTNLTSTNLLGVASRSYSRHATGTINTWGSRNEVQTGLTIGSDYYVQTDGTITTPALLLHSLLAQPLAQPKLI